jgi:hypothetical protein
MKFVTDNPFTLEIFSWTDLGSLLSSSTSRVIYTLPVVGYVILYSDYFQSLHKFSTLPHGGFLTFSARVSLFYYGALVLLVAYGLWWRFSPPLLRGKRDLQHFVSDIVVARDRSTVVVIARSPPFTRETRDIFGKTLDPSDLGVFENIVHSITSRGHALGDGAGEYEHTIPTALGFYFTWQNATRPVARMVIGVIALLGFFLVLLPSLDLLIRVLSTHYHWVFK